MRHHFTVRKCFCDWLKNYKYSITCVALTLKAVLEPTSTEQWGMVSCPRK